MTTTAPAPAKTAALSADSAETPQTAIGAPSLFEGFKTHREALTETLKAVFSTAFGKDPEGVDAASLPKVTSDPIPLTREMIEPFILATCGTTQDFVRGDDLLMPPTFASVWGMTLLSQVLRKSNLKLPLIKVLHAGNQVRFARWPRTGDLLHVTAEIVSIDKKPSRTIAVARLTHTDARGELYFTVDTTVFFPGQPSSASPRGDKAANKIHPRVPYGTTELTRFAPTLASIRRYTAVGGDFNPVHVSDLAAKASGFPRAFIHGYAEKAIAAHAVIHEALGGDPERLVAMDVSFRRPLFTGIEAGIYLGPAQERDGETVRSIDIGPGPGERSFMSGSVTVR
ncbi:MAG: MaoC/PaaZ C-terminal domain-containing protein [Planctomycetota bacterium]|jgi:acyl dehydratase